MGLFTKKNFIFFCLILILLGFGKNCFATITIGANANWSTCNGGVAPTVGDDIVINNGATLTVDVVGGVCNSIQVGSTAATAGAGTLFFQASKSIIVTGNVIFGFGGQTGTVTMGLTSQLTCSNFVLNTFGGWTPSTGTVVFTGTGTLPSASILTFSTLTINSGANITLGVSLTTVATLNVNGTLNLSTFNIPPAAVNLTGGTITGTTGLMTLGGNVTTIASATTATISCLLALTNATTRTFTVAEGAADPDLDISNVISTTGALTKAGTGSLILSAANTYTGLTTISAGTLKLGASTAVNTSGPLGTTAGATSVASGAVLDLNGFSLTAAATEPLTLIGTGLTALPAGALTNTGGNATYIGAITLGAGGATITATASGTLTCSGAIGGNTRPLTLDGAGTGTISGVIGTTTGTLTKNGTGIWTISGVNTFSGATAVNVGTLKFGSTTSLGTSSATTVASGAVLDLNGFTLTTARPLTLNGTGLTALPAGALTNTGGNASYSGAITLGAGGATITATASGTLTCSGAVGGNTRPLTLDGAGIGTISGVIGTTTGTLTKNGTGTWTISGINTFSGVTAINAGTLKLGSTTSLGTSSSTTVANGAVLDLNGFTLTTARPLTLNGTGLMASPAGALTNTGGNASYSGAITLGTLNGATITATASGTITCSGAVGGATFPLTLDGAGSGTVSGIIGTTTGTLTKNGAGTWTLSGINTYTGLTTVSAGTLTHGNNDVLSTGPVTVDGATAVWSLNTRTETVGTVTVSNGGSITSSTGVLTTTGTYEMQSGLVSAILAGAVALNKTTSGTITLSGLNTYTGATTITEGILVAGVAKTAANGAFGNASAVTLGGGTLQTGAAGGFTETQGTLTLTDNTTIALGTGVHTLTFANSSGVAWTSGKMITITGWTGNWNGTGGATAGRIFVGTLSSHLTCTQIPQIRFYDGSTYFPSTILGTGEVVPFPNTIIVSNTNDAGAGSLRQAITDANAHCGHDIINFTTSGTLTLASVLPTLNIDNAGVTIDGTTAPGWVANSNPTGSLNSVCL